MKKIIDGKRDGWKKNERRTRTGREEVYNMILHYVKVLTITKFHSFGKYNTLQVFYHINIHCWYDGATKLGT